MTNISIISLCLLAAGIISPYGASAQESLLLKTVRSGSGLVYSVSYSSDGKKVAFGGISKTVRLIDPAEGTPLRSLKGNLNFVNSVAFSPDSSRVISAGEDGTVRLWDAASGKALQVFRGHKDSVSAVVFFPDGKRLASCGTDGIIRIWKPGSRRPVMEIRAHSGYANALAISPDGSLIASGSADGTVKLWDAATGSAAAALEGHRGAVTALAFSPDGKSLASAGEDRTVKLWRVSDNVCRKTLQHQSPVFFAAFSPDSSRIFSGGEDKVITFWDADSGAQARVFKGHTGTVRSVAISPDGKRLVSGGFDKTIRFWLTPWEAERIALAEKEAAEKLAREKKEAEERAANYEQHFKAGMQLLYSPTLENLRLAGMEFQQALNNKYDEECAEKLRETTEKINREEARRKRIKLNILAALFGVALLLVIRRFVAGARKKKRDRLNLPDDIKRETLTGNYDRALEMYRQYKAMGGDLNRLHSSELRDLFQSLRTPEDLPKEPLPAAFLLDYASFYAQDGNYRLAAAMLRSGTLADALASAEDFERLATIYIKLKTPGSIPAVKLKPGTYTSMAEAFHKAGDRPACLRVLELKKQFYPSEMSARDQELSAPSGA